MTNEMKNIPTIRFKNFTDAWEQRNLGEVFKEFSDKNHSELPPLTIIQGEGTVLRDDSDRSLQYDRTSLPNYKMVNKGDFIVHLRSFEGGLEIATTQGIISPAYHTFHGEKIDSRFYYAFFRSEKFIKHDLFPYVYGIRDGKSIDIEGMKKIRIPFPPQEEQKRIGDFIDSLDSVLTLHQRKFDHLKKLKNYFLQNLFPSKGEKVPKVRFKEFTGDWEQRKLGEIFKIRTEKNGSKYTRKNVLTVSDEYGCVNQIKFHGRSFAGEDISNYKVVHKGDIIYTKSPLRYKPYGIIKRVNNENGIVSPLYIVNKIVNSCNSIFMYYFFDTPQRTNNYLKHLVRKGAKNTMNISNLEWLSGDVIISPYLNEQEKIGCFFVQLDKIITLYQHQLDQLQSFKKFMLQNMFV